MSETMVVDGVRSTYSMIKTRDGKGVLAYLQDATSGLWELVGHPGVAFPTAAEAQAAVLGQISERKTGAPRVG